MITPIQASLCLDGTNNVLHGDFFYLYALTMVLPFYFLQFLSLFWSDTYTFTTSTYILQCYYDMQPSVFIY